MNVKVLNLSLLLAWLLILIGGVIIHPGWGLAIAGGVLLVVTLAGAYIFGITAPKPAGDDKNKGESA